MSDKKTESPEIEKKRSLRNFLEDSDAEEKQSLRNFLEGTNDALNVKHLRNIEIERVKFRQMQAKLQKEFDDFRERTNAETIKREESLHREREKLQSLFAAREAALMNKQSEFEHILQARQREVETLRVNLNEEVVQKEAKLAEAQLELQQEKERYNQENRDRLDRTSKKYVVDAIDALQLQETKFHQMSERWSQAGAGALVVGLIFFAAITLTSLYTLPENPTWELIVFSFVKGLIAVALLGALARYAFLLSNAYVREALKNSDRRHAINFGKFYLESYGAAADWSQVKEAFEHWNISGSNAFSPQEDASTDISSLVRLVPLLEKVNKAFSKPSS